MLRVRDSMTREVATLGPEASVAQAWHLCRDRGIRHVPVVEDGRLVGLVSDRDLRDASPVRRTGEGDQDVYGWASLRDIMSRNPVTIHPLDTIEHAAREIYERRIGCLPVVGEDGLAGIITSSDMMRTLIEIFGAGEGRGTWIEVEVPDQPGQLAGITDAVRGTGVNILSAFVAPAHRSSDKTITLRLDTTNAKGIVKKLEEAGYSIETVASTAPVETVAREH